VQALWTAKKENIKSKEESRSAIENAFVHSTEYNKISKRR